MVELVMEGLVMGTVMAELRSRIVGGEGMVDDAGLDWVDESRSGVEDQRETIGASWTHWIIKRSSRVGHHDMLLTGACCTVIMRGRRLFKSQIQTVVGVESSLVAQSVPSLLNESMLIPCLIPPSPFSATAVGGVAG